MCCGCLVRFCIVSRGVGHYASEKADFQVIGNSAMPVKLTPLDFVALVETERPSRGGGVESACESAPRPHCSG